MKIALEWLTAGFLALSAAAATAQPAQARDYPSQPVKLVVPYAPGGPNDVMARLLAQKLTASLGGSFFVENTPGAGGTIGAGAAANSAADGYTLLVANQDVVVQPIIKSKVSYDPFKSFTPVTLLVSAPEMVVVNPSLPAKTISELIDLLKTNPGKYSYASPGVGTTPHLACEWLFKLQHGLDVAHVPYQGAAPAVQSTIAGQTQIFHVVLPAVAQHVRAGTLRPLAVTASKRSTFFPDVPTMAEAGVSGHETGFWMVLLAPSGTPKAIIDTLNAQVVKILEMSDVKERLQTMTFDSACSTPDAAAAHMRLEADRWTKVVRDTGIKVD
jgi:tripartite-type tricarboxylate transporter receptor subunit TctC